MPITEFSAGSSSSSSSNAFNGNSIAAKPLGNKSYNSDSINNTLSKARNNADIQPLDKTLRTTSKVTTRRRGLRGIKKNMSLSRLEDRRILDRGIVSNRRRTL